METLLQRFLAAGGPDTPKQARSRLGRGAGCMLTQRRLILFAVYHGRLGR